MLYSDSSGSIGIATGISVTLRVNVQKAILFSKCKNPIKLKLVWGKRLLIRQTAFRCKGSGGI